MAIYILESGMTPKPLTRIIFKEIVDQHMTPGLADNLLLKLDDGSLKLEGYLVDYRIGIHENGHWTVLNEQGGIRRGKNFNN